MSMSIINVNVNVNIIINVNFKPQVNTVIYKWKNNYSILITQDEKL